jgi:hypothetical protein
MSQAAVPALPYNPASGFHFHDCWTAVDVEMNGKAFKTTASCACTLYSKEIFNGSDAINLTATFIDLQDSILGFGILGAAATDGCRVNCVGHSDITDSIGCAVGRGEVIIVYKGRTLLREPTDTRNGTAITLNITNGRTTFAVDGRRLNCQELLSLNLSKGRFRIGVSPTKSGQSGALCTPAELLQIAAAAAARWHLRRYDAHRWG